MKYLLDTQALLFIAADSPRLTPKSREFFLHADNEPHLSVVSAWEIAIKVSIGKLGLSMRPGAWVREQLATNQIALLPVELDHVARVADLPFHHKDPFDRMLIAQALCERLPVLSSDASFDAYGVERIW